MHAARVLSSCFVIGSKNGCVTVDHVELIQTCARVWCCRDQHQQRWQQQQLSMGNKQPQKLVLGCARAREGQNETDLSEKKELRMGISTSTG